LAVAPLDASARADGDPFRRKTVRGEALQAANGIPVKPRTLRDATSRSESGVYVSACVTNRQVPTMMRRLVCRIIMRMLPRNRTLSQSIVSAVTWSA